MTREELKDKLEELLEQDKELIRIYNRRKEIAEEARRNGLHNELWEMLFADGESHYSF